MAEEIKKIKRLAENNDPDVFGVLLKELLSLKTEVSNLKERLSNLEGEISGLKTEVTILIQQNQQLNLILKYVVTPLIIILGALVGVKMTMP